MTDKEIKIFANKSDELQILLFRESDGYKDFKKKRTLMEEVKSLAIQFTDHQNKTNQNLLFDEFQSEKIQLSNFLKRLIVGDI